MASREKAPPIIRLAGVALDFDASSLDRSKAPGDISETWSAVIGIEGGRRWCAGRIEALDRAVYPIWAARGVVDFEHESFHSTLRGRCRVESIDIRRGYSRVSITVEIGGVGNMTRIPR
jgi:hypothetical protein